MMAMCLETRAAYCGRAAIVSLVVAMLFGGCALPDMDLSGATQGTSSGTQVSAASPTPDSSLVGPAEDSIVPDGEADTAVAYLNRIRTEMGLAPVRLDETLAESSQGHAEYLWLNPVEETGLSAHREQEGQAGFQGATIMDRVRAAGVDMTGGKTVAEVVAWHPRSTSAVVDWLETAYHRLPLLNPQLVAIGYGHIVADGRNANVMNLMGDTSTQSSVPPIVTYPLPDATDVAASWNGIEVPAPPAPTTGFPSGPVISLSTRPGADLQITTHTLTDEDGHEIAHVLATPNDDPNLNGSGALLLYANDPLESGAIYRVRLAGTIDGSSFERAWSFETAPSRDDCFPTDGACGPGRACYHTHAPLKCQFEGILPERSPCESVNDCSPGLTCHRGACQPYCSTRYGVDPELPLCAEACEHGHEDLSPGAPGLGICNPGD